MLRSSIFVATVLALGCRTTTGPRNAPPSAVDDRALRVRVAHAEARRAGGVDELVELTASNDPHARELALRGLGRVGGAKALAAIRKALADHEPRVVAAALSAIAVAGALDDTLKWSSEDAAVRLLGSADAGVRAAAADALGHAGSALVQAGLAACVANGQEKARCALALGLHGRRKIKLSAETRQALVAATSADDRALRYGAVYALAREHEPETDAATAAALVARVADGDPEIRALAIAGLAKRKAIASGRAAIELALLDEDWRVAAEAVRALANADDSGRAMVIAAFQQQWAALVKGNSAEAHVIDEALHALIGKPIADPAQSAAIASLGTQAAAEQSVPEIVRGWIDCLSRAAVSANASAAAVDAIAGCALPDHLELPLLADLVKGGVHDAALERGAMRVLLASPDSRVRAAGLSLMETAWPDTDETTHQAWLTTITAALASKDVIDASAGESAAEAIYDKVAGTPMAATLASAIVARATSETDVELSMALYDLIGSRQIADGAAACRAGLTGHPLRVKSALECLRKLGEPAAEPARRATPMPTDDVDMVIGHSITWHLETSRGPIDIALRPDIAPWAVASIVALTKRGFYDGLEFHRVVPDFVVQGGDPTSSGYGGPGYMLPAEPASSVDVPGFQVGGVGMADSGPDSAGSQWFIMHGPAPHLDARYTWIGSVTTGQKVADALMIGDRVEHATVLLK